MIYAINQIPIQLLGLKRPENLEFTDNSESIFNDCLNISYACIIQISEESLKAQNEGFCSMIGIACALKSFSDCSNENFHNLLKKMNGVPPAFRYRRDDNAENAVKDLKSIKLEGNTWNKDLETLFSCSVLELS
jgi:hypothetical protein